MLLSGCEAKGAVNDSKEQKGDDIRFAQMKRGNLFLEIELLMDFSRFYERQSTALRLSSPDLSSAFAARDRESRFCFSSIQVCGSGKARFALAQCPTLRRSAFPFGPVAVKGICQRGGRQP
jgi:hypothetical protein